MKARWWMVALATLAAGCGGGVSDLTKQEATDGVEERAHVVGTRLFPAHARLEPDGQIEAPCPTGWWTTEDYVVHHAYRVRDLAWRDRERYLTAARDWWRDEGYEITRERTNGGRVIDVGAVDDEEYSMRLWRNDGNHVYLEVASPCLAAETSFTPR